MGGAEGGQNIFFLKKTFQKPQAITINRACNKRDVSSIKRGPYPTLLGLVDHYHIYNTILLYIYVFNNGTKNNGYTPFTTFLVGF